MCWIDCLLKYIDSEKKTVMNMLMLLYLSLDAKKIA